MSALVNYIKHKFVYGTMISNFENCKMVLVLRSDIPMGTGKAAAQCAHAAVECYRQALKNQHKQLFQSWLAQGQPKIVLKIPSEEGLTVLAKRARKSGLITAIIADAGRTQLKPGTISALGIGPGPKKAIDDLTSNLKLL